MAELSHHQPDPLQEWNRLARENAENALVSSMFNAGMRASRPIDKFVTWLLVGSAAGTSFLIANADKVVPFLKQRGFLICGLMLCTSCVFGLLSKIYSLRVQVGLTIQDAVEAKFVELLQKYSQEESRIREEAVRHRITIETGINMQRVLEEFFALTPWWVSLFASRHLKKYKGNAQIRYIVPVKLMTRQGICAFLRSLAFLGFIIAGVVAGGL